MHGYPLLRLGTTERDEKQVGPSGPNAVANLAVIQVEKRAKWRRVVSGDDEVGVDRLQARDGLSGRLRTAAEKEHPVTLLRGAPY